MLGKKPWVRLRRSEGGVKRPKGSCDHFKADRRKPAPLSGDPDQPRRGAGPGCYLGHRRHRLRDLRRRLHRELPAVLAGPAAHERRALGRPRSRFPCPQHYERAGNAARHSDHSRDEKRSQIEAAAALSSRKSLYAHSRDEQAKIAGEETPESIEAQLQAAIAAAANRWRASEKCNPDLIGQPLTRIFCEDIRKTRSEEGGRYQARRTRRQDSEARRRSQNGKGRDPKQPRSLLGCHGRCHRHAGLQNR